MALSEVETRPIEGQKPGTSGLRQKVAVFEREGYLENFLQAIFDAVPDLRGATMVLGGDGRYGVERAAGVAIRMAAANGVARVVVGKNALLSTPAASHLIRKLQAAGGIVLSASHNPGGPSGDFGVKFNGANGGPAPEKVTNAIFEATKGLTRYRASDAAAPDLSKVGAFDLDGMAVEVVDPVDAYAELMATLFDFAAIKAMFANGFSMRFDAMHAVTGPYARRILEGELGASPGTVINGEPLPDFGGGHPDPNLVHAKELVDLMNSPEAPDFGAASDGDGDRNLIHGRGLFVSPSDSLAVLAANASLIPMYSGGLNGAARSMPTSQALDRVCAAQGMECFETPTGWKFFGNLLDAGRIGLCGEESSGTGGSHVREKDGLWAVLFWLNVIAARGQDASEILRGHWREFGRTFYQRHDFEAVDKAAAEGLMDALRAKSGGLTGTKAAGLAVTGANEFAYTDPVDGSVAQAQGLRLFLQDDEGRDARAVLRLSGTGTEGATLRLYLERQGAPDGSDASADPAERLAPVAAAAGEIAGIKERTGRDKPDVVT